ncbi:hypothetical protein BDN71DRAFT_1437412 [Pleurotus eryngii]|uniref:Uncharacterized protein n=1 Tax=Pleurotus eryngii TaxID=5323 RepID=A0A9P5ZFV4_PLEER|nr:hypothetical protein BDN71DRAFT_1437412 [Pleurotus eryngii]
MTHSPGTSWINFGYFKTSEFYRASSNKRSQNTHSSTTQCCVKELATDAFSPLRKCSSITQEQADTPVLAHACTTLGTILCFLVLLAYGVTVLSPNGRPRRLDLLMYPGILFGIAFSVAAAQTGPTSMCRFGAFAVNLTLKVATFFTACIVINLC